VTTPSTRRPRRRRLAIPLAVGLVAAAAGRAVLRRRPALEPVADDIRTPVLYLPLSLRSETVLRILRSMPTPTMQASPGIAVESRTITGGDGGQLRVVTYQRADRPRASGALLWIHGGGLVLGTPEQGQPLCSRWADEIGCLVVSVDYRLAPEDPFPAGLEDCYAALQWLHDEADGLGVDPDRVAVGGDSAGGGLAAALSQLTRDRGGPSICFQLLEYPMLDDRTALPRDHEGRGTFVWTPTSNHFAWTAYLGHAPSDIEDRPYAAPARTDDLTDLPPTWIGVGDLDLFFVEDVDYARRLEAAGVACELHVEPGMYHGADAIRPQADTSRRFRDHMTTALAAALDDTRAARTLEGVG
jgi:acetyl esterase/lipase